MSRKLEIDEVKQEFINRNLIPLFNEYKNNNTKLLSQTQDGYKVIISIDKLRNGRKPNVFSKLNPYTIQNIKLWLQLNNKPFEILSEEFKGNNINLKWKCLKKECMEIFKATWGNIQRGEGCSFCRGFKVGLSNCLATKNQELAKEWHPTKNGDLTPYNITCNSRKKVWWQCDKGHEWRTEIYNRTNGTGCPYCVGNLPSDDYNLLIINSELCKEWDYEKNDKLPEKYCPSSGKKAWWICKECGYNWKTLISSRNRGTGCPQCNVSKANSTMIKFCKNNGIVYFPEYKIDKCKDKRPLPFDIGIIINKNLILIEADGLQHYEPVRFGGISYEKAMENFKLTQCHDQIRNNYCKNNNIPLLRIPYWEFNNIDRILKNYLNII